MLDAGSGSARRMLGGETVIAAAVVAVRPASFRNLRRRRVRHSSVTNFGVEVLLFQDPTSSYTEHRMGEFAYSWPDECI